MSEHTTMKSPLKPNLRQRLSQPRALLAPGVYDAFTALAASQAGFEALYLSGGAVAYTQLGRSDVGLTTASETADVIARITDRVDVPLIVDADNGYGNAINTQRTVRTFERAGAAMLQIEDQVFPKRCGHLDRKALITTEHMCGKLKAALDARVNENMLIMARTDAVGVEGIDAALERAEAYVACGVDALFIEALREPAELKRAASQFAQRLPLLANMVEGGKTPVYNVDELSDWGYRIVIFPGGVVRFLGTHLPRYFQSLRDHGSTAPMRAEMLDFDGLNQMIGTPELLALGEQYAD